MSDVLQSLRAEINLSGLSRKEAAKGLYLSLSALNRKLRGEIGMTEEEQERLRAMIAKRRQRGP
ncbi:MAG: hypothetical protein QM308_00410 [Bacillota bacterium]|nr:hypothetical protein [Bacillota bacterium]